jgi:hypothetical protein
MDPLHVLTGELAKAQQRRANYIERMARLTEQIAKALRAMCEEDLRIVDLERQIRLSPLAIRRKEAA